MTTITHAQAHQLLEMFSDDMPETEITLIEDFGHSGEGLYAYYTDLPQEGSWMLDATELPQPPEPSDTSTNLNCKSVQARLAASWGYVKPQPEEPDTSTKLKMDVEFVDGTSADLVVYGSQRDIKRLEARIKYWFKLEQQHTVGISNEDFKNDKYA